MPREQMQRWRLILGKSAEEEFRPWAQREGWLGEGGLLSGDLAAIDEALDMVYAGEGEAEQGLDLTREEWEAEPGTKHGAVKGRSFPRVARWLGEIRRLFPTDIVALVQKDAIERRGLKQLLFEPEMLAQVEPSVDLASMILSIKSLVPEKAKAAARELVRKVVEELRRRLESRMHQAVRGALNRNQHTHFRSLANLDWQRVIRRNLKNYNAELKKLIPEHLSFFSRHQKRNEWNVIIAMDQSGSMASSLIYGGVMGAILASMPAVETHVVAFNHQDVVDLTAECHDPVDLLFGIQLGGAEDYWMATRYCEQFMHTPARTLYILLADLYDTSSHEAKFVKKMEELLEGGLKAVTLLAISDQGKPSYNHDLAKKLTNLGMPCFGCSPDRLPDLLAAVLKGQDLQVFASQAEAPNPPR
ncbi:MAG: VWA domain-containing protein [Gemmataceae bacterium]|nr:VWA domain-containing protein [Gemmataceae bacterium]